MRHSHRAYYPINSYYKMQTKINKNSFPKNKIKCVNVIIVILKPKSLKSTRKITILLYNQIKAQISMDRITTKLIKNINIAGCVVRLFFFWRVLRAGPLASCTVRAKCHFSGEVLTNERNRRLQVLSVVRVLRWKMFWIKDVYAHTGRHESTINGNCEPPEFAFPRTNLQISQYAQPNQQSGHSTR